MTQTAPAPSLDFSINAEQVEKITADIIAEELAVNDLVASLKPEEQTYENIVVRLAKIENELSGTYSCNLDPLSLTAKSCVCRQGSIGELLESDFP